MSNGYVTDEKSDAFPYFLYIYINFLEFTGYSLQITNAYKTWKSLARISCLIRSFERATELAGISVNSGIK